MRGLAEHEPRHRPTMPEVVELLGHDEMLYCKYEDWAP